MSTVPTPAPMPDPAAVAAVFAVLFNHDEMFAGEDLARWFERLSERIAVVETALESARLQRGMIAAHLSETFRLPYKAIGERLGVTPQRAGQLAARGRQGPAFQPRDAGGYRHP
jgi:hypothetical protein